MEERYQRLNNKLIDKRTEMKRKGFRFQFSIFSSKLPVIRFLLVASALCTLHFTLYTGSLKAGVCSATYCHGNVPGLTASSQTFSGYVNPVSSNPATGKCGTCHRAGKFYDPAARRTDGTTAIISTAPAGGSHWQHSSTTTYNYSCKLCHSATLTDWKVNYTVPLSTSLHVNRATNIQFSTYSLTRPQIALGVSSPTYSDFDSWNLIYSTQPPDTSYGACKNLYCHGAFAGSGYKVNVATWGRPSDANCGTCHGAGKVDVVKATAPAGGSHLQHVSTTTYNYDCRLCHAETIDWAGRISSFPAHVDYWTEIRFSTDTRTAPRLGISPQYSGADAYNNFYGTSPPRSNYTGATCANLYCHGAINDLYLAGRATPTWNVPADGACGTCHDAGKYDTSAATAPIGWKHFKHASSGTVTGAYSYECRYCHENTVTWTGTIAFATWTHVQGLVDIKFSTSSLTTGATYWANNSPYDYYVKPATNPPYNFRACANLYCHSNANPRDGTNNYVKVYSTHTVGCTSCHTGAGTGGGINLSMSHSTHTSSAKYGFSCEQCHYETAIGTSSIRNKTVHVDGVKKASFTATWSGIYGAGIYDTPKCSNTYCHGSFPGSGYTANIATWNVPATARCGSCHGTGQYGVANASAPPSGWEHFVHVSTGRYNYPCKVCHDQTVDPAGNIISYSSHVANKKVDVKFATSTYPNVVFPVTSYRGLTYYFGATTGTYDNTTCTNTYCHSNANPYGGTNVYDSVYSTETLTCTGCHAGPGQGGGANLSVAHSTHTRPSPGYGYTCDKCHYDTVGLNSTSTIKSYLTHLSTGSSVSNRNVVFSTNTAFYTQATRACNNTYCHSAGTTTWNKSIPTSYIRWIDTGTVGCDSCHDGPSLGGPSYSYNEGGKPNVHQKHTSTTTFNFACYICHYDVMRSTTYRIDVATNHVNSVYTLKSSGTGVGFDYTFSSAPSASRCDNIQCHAGNYALWTDTVAVKCLDCHASTVDLDDYNPNNNITAEISTDTYTGWYGSKHQYNISFCTDTRCHSPASNHKDTNNPFRLNYPTYATTGSNAEFGCLSGGSCHSESAYKRHSLATTGGDNWNDVATATNTFKCVDCHDPHRDRNVFVSTAVSKSVQSLVARNTSDERGKPYYTGLSTTPVNFVLSLPKKATDYVLNIGTTTKICQTCHQANDYYTISWGSTNIHADDACGNCHKHDQGFKAACTVCHAAPGESGAHRAHYSAPAATPTSYGGGDWFVNNSSGSIYIFGCGKCHDTTHDLTGKVKTSTHTVEVFFDTTTLPANISPATYTPLAPGTTYVYDTAWSFLYYPSGRCDDSYCHGRLMSGANLTIGISSRPVWGGKMPTDPGTKCNTACHSISTGTVSGKSHRVHVSSYTLSCNICHYDTASSTYSIRYSSYHVNGYLNWNFDETDTRIESVATYTKASTITAFGQYTSSCTNVYCHSNGRPTIDPAGEPVVYSSAIWSQTADCTYCHAGSVYANAVSTMTTRRHKSHVNNAAVIGSTYTCATCHDKTLDTSSDIIISSLTNHVDGVRTVSFTVTGDWVQASSQCANLYCHSDGKGTTYTVKWDTWTTYDCKGCHGTSTVSNFGEPDYTNTGPGTLRANTHEKHVSLSADCAKCHYLTADAQDGNKIKSGSNRHTDRLIHISTGMGNYSFKYSTAPGATPVGIIDYSGTVGVSTRTCSNISCHNGGQATWGGTVSCLDCHASTVDFDDYNPNNNITAEISTDTYTGWYGSKHYQYNVTCTTTNCHDPNSKHYDTNNPFRLKYATYSYTTDFGCRECHDGSPATNAVRHSSTTCTGDSWGQGSYSPLQDFKCIDCHDPHRDRNVFVSTGVAKLVQSLVARRSSNPQGVPDFSEVNFSTTPVNFILSVPTVKATDYVMSGGTTTKVCQTCHQANDYYTISWGSTTEHYGSGDKCTNCHKHEEGFKAACNVCHGAPPTAYGKHSVHYDTNVVVTAYGGTANRSSGSKYDYDCGKCHKSTHGEDEPKSSTHTVEVFFDTATLPANISPATYTRLAPGTTDQHTSGHSYLNYLSGSCDNTYCHGRLMSGANITIGISSKPVWGGAMPADPGTKCRTACHNYSIFTTTSGKSHSIHVSSQQYSCTICHYDTAESTFSVRYSSYHVNGWMNINFNEGDTRILSYSSYAAVTIFSTGTLGNYTGKFCTNIYCHSTVQGSSITTVTNPPTYRSVSWSSGTLSCEACHNTSSTTATANLTGSHYAHIKSTFAYTCDKCHPYNNPRLSVYISSHSDKRIQVTTGGYTGGIGPQDAYGKCSNVSCHGQDVNFQWGTEIATDCAKCHLNPGAGADVDQFGQGWFNGTLAMISSSTFWTAPSSHTKFGCANDNCHDATGIHTSTNPFRLATVTYSTTSPNAEFGCGNCHTTQVRHSSYTTKGDATKNWGQGSNNPPINFKCIDCHDPHMDGNVSGLQKIIARGGSSTDTYKNGAPNFNVGLGTKTITVTILAKATDYVYNLDVGTDTKICQTCHQANKFYTVYWGSATAHYANPPDDSLCSGCHAHTGGFSAAGCSGCHGNSTANTYWPDGSTAKPENTAGSHLKHVKAINKFDPVNNSTTTDTGQKNICEFCHVDVPGTTNHNNGTTNLEHFQNIAGTLQTSPTTGYYVISSSKCYDIGCHARKETYNWYSVPVSSCGQCHITGGAFNPGTLAHPAHVSTYSYTCTECHPNNYLVTPSSYAHTDAQVDMWWSSGTVNISTTAFYDKYKKASSTTGFTPSWVVATSTFGSCYNLYCHRPSSWTEISWNQTWASTSAWSGINRCKMCHDLPPRFSATTKSSYTHYGDHTTGATGTVNASTYVFTALGQNAGEIGGYNFGCAKCHPDPTSDASKHVRGMAVRSSSMTANLTFDATTDPKNPNVTWSTGAIARQDSRGYWFTNTRCSSTFCHGTTLPSGMRTGTYVTTPTWNTDLAEGGDSACGACHARRNATSGSHEKHVSVNISSYGYNCELCHYDTARSSYTVKYSSHHVDGKASWNFDEMDTRIKWVATYKGAHIGSTGTFANYGDGVAISTCGNLYCHSKGQKDYKQPNREPRWGKTGGIGTDCYGCHGSTVNYTVLTATHVIHVSTNTSKREYDYTCETCHRDTVTGKTTIKNYTYHVSGAANVTFATSTAVGYNRTFPNNSAARYVVWSSSGTCWDTYCHSDGTPKKTGLRPSSTIYWGR